MPKRLDGIKAIKESSNRVGRKGMGETLTIDVRPIDNGFITRHSHYKDDGSYSCKEMYSDKRPKVGAAEEPNADTNAMRTAADFLNRK